MFCRESPSSSAPLAYPVNPRAPPRPHQGAVRLNGTAVFWHARLEAMLLIDIARQFDCLYRSIVHSACRRRYDNKPLSRSSYPRRRRNPTITPRAAYKKRSIRLALPHAAKCVLHGRSSALQRCPVRQKYRSASFWFITCFQPLLPDYAVFDPPGNRWSLGPAMTRVDFRL